MHVILVFFSLCRPTLWHVVFSWWAPLCPFTRGCSSHICHPSSGCEVKFKGLMSQNGQVVFTSLMNNNDHLVLLGDSQLPLDIVQKIMFMFSLWWDRIIMGPLVFVSVSPTDCGYWRHTLSLQVSIYHSCFICCNYVRYNLLKSVSE